MDPARKKARRVTSEQILSTGNAAHRFNKLVAAGLPQDILRDAILLFANATNKKPSFLPGMEPRDLHRFVFRVVKCAREIDSMNRRLARWFYSGWPFFSGNNTLPREMALYGLRLRNLANFHQRTRMSSRQQIKLLLISMARKFSGKSHYKDLADLLAAALAVAGEQADISAPALIQLAKDHASDLELLSAELEKLAKVGAALASKVQHS